MPATSDFRTRQVLSEAKEEAEQYHWKEAAKLCSLELGQLQLENDPAEKASQLEVVAKFNFKSAFQSNNRTDFEKDMRIAEDLYGRTAESYDKAGKMGLARRAISRKTLATFWLLTDHSQRRSIISKCIELSRSSIDLLSKQGNGETLAESNLDLLKCLRESCSLSKEYEILKEEFEAALNAGRQAIAGLENTPRIDLLLEALSLTVWLLAVEAQVVLSPAEFQALEPETRRLETKLSELSEKLGTPFALCLAKEAAGHLAFDLEGNPETALNRYKESAEIAKRLEDSLILGRLLWVIAHAENWLGSIEDGEGRRRTLLSEGLDLSSEATRELEVSFATTDLAAAYAEWAECHIEFANLVERDPARKKDHFRKATSVASKGLLFESGTLASNHAAHAMAKAMYFRSRMEPRDQKNVLLREALPVRQNTVLVADRVLPHFWEPVVMRNYLALIESELALEEQDMVNKNKLLKMAVGHLEQCLELGAKWAVNAGFPRWLAQYSESLGDALGQIFSLTEELETATKAVQAYDKAVAYFAQSKTEVAIGPVKWKTAKLYDALGEFGKASDAFNVASETFRNGARVLPGSGHAFEELTLYMDAWAAIEVARLQHSEGDYKSASEVYTKAAIALEKSRTWTYLSRLCVARSLLEKGELLSREEDYTRSLSAFGDAGKTFEEARVEIENKIRSAEAQEQRDLGVWQEIATQREAYCRGRIELEEAGALSRKGDKTASAKKYNSAAGIFGALAREIQNPQDQSEVETFVFFCKAWAMMKEAELTLSPELYRNACDNFLMGKDKTNREIFRLLALANASICKALESSTRFRLSGDLALYSQIKEHLESAANHYHEAGFKKTENWTRATQRLFDALLYLSEAETERDHRKKSEFYHLAEKQLELSAKLFGEAGFPGKRKEAMEHLGRTRLEKDALLAPIETLSQIPTASGVPLAYLSLPRGGAGGVERFEGACVVGDMIIQQRELIAGSEVSLELEIANVGKTSATLVKLEFLPPHGFEYDKEMNLFVMEDGFIDLRGKRIEHLKTFQVNVRLKAVQSGLFDIRPRVFYVDDFGNYTSFQFQQTTLTVMERRATTPPISLAVQPVTPETKIPEGFRFETKRAQEIFQQLVEDFLHDYMSKRLYVEKAGWRSLMGLVRETKIPRSAVYSPRGRHGPAIAELERRGLIELRIFPRERGRGGAVKKVRVAYENEIVKRIVEDSVKTKD